MKPVDRSLHLASTPLIALIAAGAARAHPGEHRLVLLGDFPAVTSFAELLRRWRDNPFSAIDLLPGRVDEVRLGAGDRAPGQRSISNLLQRARVKRQLRRETLARMETIDLAFEPTRVFLGNDRKPETQLALVLASARAGGPCGQYLDDGLYTYLGDVRQRPWTRRIDGIVKRWAYGSWWRQISHAGTSPWIGRAWLARPDLAPPVYAMSIESLPRVWFVNRAFARLARLAVHHFGVPDRHRFDALALLPHSNQFRGRPGLRRAVLEALARAATAAAVKYHPRELEPDPLRLADEAVAACLLPAALPAELLALRVARGACVIGEGSTALLALKWLRPDLDVRDLGAAADGYAVRARPLLAAFGVHPLEGGPSAGSAPDPD